MKEKKDRRNRFFGQAADPGSAELGLSLAERLARHVRWSAAISSAFRRGKGLRTWRPATFIFGLHAKRMFSLMRSVLNLQLSWPRLEQNLSLTSNLVTQQLLSNRQESSAARQNSHSRKPGPRGASIIFWHSPTGQTVTELAKRSEHGIWPQGPLLPSTLWLTPLAGTMRLGPRGNAIPQEASAPEMTTRIMRRLTRVEQASLLPEPRLVSSPALMRGFEQVVETPARRSYHDAGPLRRSEPGAGGSTPPGINVTQLTDEVMRQIDRRLVAFRERLGKI